MSKTKIKRIIVEKSRTIELRKKGEFIKAHYTLEAELTASDDVEKVKESMEKLINSWLWNDGK